MATEVEKVNFSSRKVKKLSVVRGITCVVYCENSYAITFAKAMVIERLWRKGKRPLMAQRSERKQYNPRRFIYDGIGDNYSLLFDERVTMLSQMMFSKT